MSAASVQALAATGANGSPLIFPSIDYATIFPELLLSGGALLLMLISSLVKEKASQKTYAVFTVIVAIAAAASTWWPWVDLNNTGPHSAFGGAIATDHFGLFFVVVISLAVILSAFVAGDWLERQHVQGPEFFVLMMLSAAGGMLMAQANDLIVVFLGLEVLSIALYILAGFNRKTERSREAALKYFVLGAFSSAIFLYGIALIYGATGTTNLSSIAKFLSTNTVIDDGILLAGMALLVVGFAFKVAAVPFQQWTPDVYEGSPTPVTAFMAAAAKAAGFAALIRVFAGTLFTLKVEWQPIVLALALLTLLVGSVVACVQQNVKRMLAYSSISHAGFVLLGLQAATRDGAAASLFYLLVYTFMVIGSFAIVAIVGGKDDANHNIEAYRGLGRERPVLGMTFTVLLLAQAGVPLTSGFLAKFYVISALVENGSYATSVFAMLTAAIAAFFYLRIVVMMYSSPADDASAGPEPATLAANNGGGVAILGSRPMVIPAATWIALAVSLIVTVAFGILPQHVIDPIRYARQAATDLF